jgi:hypothetical protein
MSDPITKPQAVYSLLPEDEKKLIDKLVESLFEHARIPSLQRLAPEKAKQCALAYIDLGLLKVCRTDDKAWLELHNGRGYIRV